MNEVRLIHVDSTTILPYAAALRALERDITYPLNSDDKSEEGRFFRIDHGADYHRFFSTLGQAHFVLGLRGDQVVATIAGVLRNVRAGTAAVPALYLCDFKVSADLRGSGLSRRILLHGLSTILRTPSLRKWRLAYGAAMRGAQGDVMRSARGLHPYRLARPLGRLHVYFVPPARLASLDPRACPPPPPPGGLDLSPDAPESDFISTAGRKDLRLDPTGTPWPLAHLPAGPAAWQPTLGAYLQRCGAALLAAAQTGPACFALDERLIDQIAWLRQQQLVPGALCTAHGLSLTPHAWGLPWIHLSTAEI